MVAALAAAGLWIKIYYTWRPNLSDEDHMALAATVRVRGLVLVTSNLADISGREVRGLYPSKL